jgi:hypothetical protein
MWKPQTMDCPSSWPPLLPVTSSQIKLNYCNNVSVLLMVAFPVCEPVACSWQYHRCLTASLCADVRIDSQCYAVKPVLNGPCIKRNFVLNGNIFRSRDYHSIPWLNGNLALSEKCSGPLRVRLRQVLLYLLRQSQLTYELRREMWLRLKLTSSQAVSETTFEVTSFSDWRHRTSRILIGRNVQILSSFNLIYLFSRLISLFWKNKKGLWDHLAVCISVCDCPYKFPPPFIF